MHISFSISEDHHEGDVAQDPKVANEKEAQATEVKSELEKQSTVHRTIRYPIIVL